MFLQLSHAHNAGRHDPHAGKQRDLVAFALFGGGLGVAAHAEHESRNRFLGVRDAIKPRPSIYKHPWKLSRPWRNIAKIVHKGWSNEKISGRRAATLIWTQPLLAILCGSAVGFSLGLIGGGGSILAVPLLLYVVGIGEPHIAIGTSALAVSANAFTNLIGHSRAGTVKWSCAGIFASAGVIGAAAGSTLGKLVDGQRLLFLFALVMIAVGLAMLVPRESSGNADVHVDSSVAVRLGVLGLATGAIAGFFGIGGGFLIVPGILFASGMPILNAIGCSLLSVGAFGLTTALNYALSGLIEWPIAIEFIAGGALGGYFGRRSAVALATHRGWLTYLFVAIIFAVAAYILARTGVPL